MTLLVTEFHVDRVVFAADRAITNITTGKRLDKQQGSQKKIHEIPRLNGGIGFYGLAQVGAIRMTDWISRFLTRRTDVPSLGALASALRAELEAAIPAQHHLHILGFHIAGYNTDGNPELWHVNNTITDRKGRHGGPRFNASEDFLREHARDRYGYKGAPGEKVRIKDIVSIYRNGDLRGHVFTNEELDRMMAPFRSEPDFRPIRDAEEYLKFKMSIIVYIYKHWCRRRWIGGPIDSFTIRPKRR